jgi:uncharacterized protein
MTVYEPRIDPDALVAIDMHVHVEQDSHGTLSLDDDLMAASAKYFKSSDNRTPTVAYLAERYRTAKMAAVIFTVDATTATGHPALSSEAIAAEAAEHADVLIPFGSVDPHRGPDAIEQARRLVRKYGVRGFKFHPSLQAFSPDDERFRSGWSPKYFPAELVKAAAGMLSGKVLFGSDYPLITPERWLDDFASLDIRADVLPGIFKENACRVLRLA